MNLFKTTLSQATSLPEQPSQPEMSQTKWNELLLFEVLGNLRCECPKCDTTFHMYSLQEKTYLIKSICRYGLYQTTHSDVQKD
jgi:phage FluMu protein Com